MRISISMDWDTRGHERAPADDGAGDARRRADHTTAMVERRDYLVSLRPRPSMSFTAEGRSVLAVGPRGFIAAEPGEGLFFHQTRILSRYRYTIDGDEPQCVVHSNVEQHSWLGYYIRVPPGCDSSWSDQGSGQMQASSEETLELLLARYVGQGMHEDVNVTNYSQARTSFRLCLEIDADFADQLETAGERRQRGERVVEWRERGSAAWELRFDYRASHHYDHQGHRGTAELHRGLCVRLHRCDSPPRYEDGRIVFAVALDPGERWHTCVALAPILDDEVLEPRYGCRSFTTSSSEEQRERERSLADATEFDLPETHTLASVVAGALDRAKLDLASLRLADLDSGDRGWTVAAGLPMYVALFGRDTLTASWQAAPLTTDLLRGTLHVLARWQGDEIDDWRDEQPGRMLHEAHSGPLAKLKITPRERYYGSNTTSSFYPVALSALWHWSADREAVAPLLDSAVRAVRWVDDYARRDGFHFYQTRSEQGVKHQAWKDSPDAIVDENGRQVEPPIATCEEQAFVFMAKLRLAEVLWWFDRKDEAKHCFHSAMELKKRFGDAFWMEDQGFVALGLNARDQQIRAITSNPGHCLAAAILDESMVQRTAERLFAPDLFSGWGIRTLSSDNPAYSPFSYHRGSVWPVEHGSFALGFMRYGLHEQMQRICRAQFEAVRFFQFQRLPESISGHPRDADHPFPAFYPQANSPQAWSSSAMISFAQALLGLYPYAPLHTLFVDPQLPDWLPEITLRNLRVGDASAAIRFYRSDGGASTYEVLDVRGKLHVVRQPSPWSLTTSFAERVKDFVVSLLPGK